MRYGSIKCCKIIGFGAADLRKKLEILSFPLVLLNF
jgi:hypothetical protein